MKIFTCKLRDLVGTASHPVSMAPRDVLFRSQRQFLEKIFDITGVRFKRADVEVPTDGSPIVFRCDISTHANVYHTIANIVEAHWGDFEVKRFSVSNVDKDGKDYNWIRVSFFVECNDRGCQYLEQLNRARAEDAKKDTLKEQEAKE